MNAHDVYSYGVVSSSTLYRIRGAFPPPEGYAEIDDVCHMTGGEATNSSIVLARLGARVTLDGNWLGADEPGKRTKAMLEDYRVDTSRLLLKEECESVQEVVFSAAGSRTIFGTYGRLLEEAHWNQPRESDITSAQVVSLDPFFARPASLAAEIAFGSGIPVVTVDCRHDDPLLKYVSAVVIADSYVRGNYPGYDREELFRKYQAATGGLVVFSHGDKPLWYARPDHALISFDPYPVEAVDTTGGGDAFRAGIVYGFLQGWDDEETIRFATAAAAIICTRFPGVLNAPTSDEVFNFIKSHGSK